MATLHERGSGRPVLATAPVQLADPRFGDGLKCLFEDAATGPMPDRLTQLANALEAAFERGELRGACSRRGKDQ